MEKQIKIKPRVLYVDDEETNLNSFKQLFRRNFDVYIALSADEGLAILSENKVDVIISDQRMPKHNGSEFLMQVAEKYPNTLRFMLTGYSDLQAIVDAVNNGNIDGYLSKPLDTALLLEKIEKGLKVKHLEDVNSELLKETIESEEKFKALIAASNTGAWIWNADTEFLDCTEEYFSMLGRFQKDYDLSGNNNLNETWIDLLHPDDRDQASTHFADYLAGGSLGMYENHFRMLHANGNWIWIWSRGATLRDDNGKLKPVTVGTHIDITNRIEAENELKKYQNDLEILVNERTEELKSANSTLIEKTKELEEFNNAMLDREMRIIELKEEVNTLAKTLKIDIPYPEIDENK